MHREFKIAKKNSRPTHNVWLENIIADHKQDQEYEKAKKVQQLLLQEKERDKHARLCRLKDEAHKCGVTLVVEEKEKIDTNGNNIVNEVGDKIMEKVEVCTKEAL
eukprot:5870878-Ditylum_brightwellii.AAC.1